ncbi:hypothetical protein KAM644c_33430 [Klebsiella quasipneumoniae subsp. quasipneumoniae]|uniref:Uncharacterized protein n=1 Tax=Klebsiella quasipneumoniae subsp. quasipneumoniae TaxID=1667327 RepID=A0AAN1Y676_9ENTR|nr:hypothetical protein KAM622c_34440 [Klebsiella quasipneumoniae subsp. quasipneumoniae]BDO14277.1 hypothetical protein KAM644c_33430 [Klebsiella quasipneumoniae subsp. quasipneumoniae]BDO20248.1 hypothetical protein KAM645c_33380 [Klebsiella quasipneumoniae subsp. quasipneumoniae]GKP86879.1 hypothetical protein NUKP71_03610 [Klebsiella quasipneumoniae]
MTISIRERSRSVVNYLNSLFFYLNTIGITSMGDVGPIQAKGEKTSGKALFMQVFS